MAPPTTRPLKDPEQYYAYVWRLDGVAIWVGHGHNVRGNPTPRNVTGRPTALAKVLAKRWREIQREVYPCGSRELAIQKEIDLTVSLKPLYNSVVGFAGFAGKRHSEETKQRIRETGLGRKPSDLCRQKASERMTERNRASPPRKGKRCSEEHRRKLSEAAKRRYANRRNRG